MDAANLQEIRCALPARVRTRACDGSVRFLTKVDRDRLINSYTAHVQPVATMLAFHGLRVQTALQIQWGVNGIDMIHDAIRLNHTKNAVIQSVPMHERVRTVLYRFGKHGIVRPRGTFF